MTSHFNQLTEPEAERLALLIEECGEIIQIAAKILRHGYESHNPTIPVVDDERPQTNRSMLEKELGDMVYAKDLMRRAEDVSLYKINLHASEKANRTRRWLHHQT